MKIPHLIGCKTSGLKGLQNQHWHYISGNDVLVNVKVYRHYFINAIACSIKFK